MSLVSHEGVLENEAQFLVSPHEWIHNSKLTMCSIGAKGLYVTLLMNAHWRAPYGRMKIGARVYPDHVLPGICGCSPHEFEVLLQELLEEGLVTKDSDGVIVTQELHIARTRAPIPDSVRRAVVERDYGICRYCGTVPEKPTMDHVIPWSRNGSDGPDNLVTACLRCNLKKNDRTPEEAGMTLLPVPDLQDTTQQVR